MEPVNFASLDDFQTHRTPITQHIVEMWHATPSTLGEGVTLRTFTPQQQRQYLRRIKRLATLDRISETFRVKALRKYIGEKGVYLWNDFIGLKKDEEHDSMMQVFNFLSYVSRAFVAAAKTIDAQASRAEVFKAGRTLWFMVAWQLILAKDPVLNNAMIGYNLLYPYTDNLLDDPNVTAEEKRQFARAFRRRLCGENVEPTNKNERIIYTLVGLIEEIWSHEDNAAVYHSLVSIHDAQSASVGQLRTNGFQPSTSFLESISANKGGASVMAAGFVCSGMLNEEKFEYLECLGLGLQLLDDLQDVREDLASGQMTLFSERIVANQTLDEPTAKLINYIFHPRAVIQFTGEKNEGLPNYVRRAIAPFALLLVLEAAAKLQQYYSPEFYERLSSLSPLPFSMIRRSKTRVEDYLYELLLRQGF